MKNSSPVGVNTLMIVSPTPTRLDIPQFQAFRRGLLALYPLDRIDTRNTLDGAVKPHAEALIVLCVGEMLFPESRAALHRPSGLVLAAHMTRETAEERQITFFMPKFASIFRYGEGQVDGEWHSHAKHLYEGGPWTEVFKKQAPQVVQG